MTTEQSYREIMLRCIGYGLSLQNEIGNSLNQNAKNWLKRMNEYFVKCLDAVPRAIATREEINLMKQSYTSRERNEGIAELYMKLKDVNQDVAIPQIEQMLNRIIAGESLEIRTIDDSEESKLRESVRDKIGELSMAELTYVRDYLDKFYSVRKVS